MKKMKSVQEKSIGNIKRKAETKRNLIEKEKKLIN